MANSKHTIRHRIPGPFAGFEWHVAGRYLRARRKEGFVSVIAGFSLAGIALGVATLIIVMAVMNGFRTELLGKILGVNGHVIVQSWTGQVWGYDDIIADLKDVPGVANAHAVVPGQVMTSGPRGARGAMIRGMSEEALRDLPIVAGNIREGSLDNFKAGTVAIGTRMAFNMGVGVGDKLTLISPQGRSTPFGTAPRIVGYEVAAIFELGMSEYDGLIVYMPIGDAQRYFNMGDSAGMIEILIDNPDNVDAYRDRIDAALTASLDRQGRSRDTIRLRDWRDLNPTYFSALQVERNVMFLILTLIILVAALNIISGMIMLVKDKGRDIAILRTMGMSSGSVMRIFFIAGASIGTLGTAIGVALGTLFCAYIEEIRQLMSRLTGTELFSPEIYFLSRMPAELNVSETVMICLMALALSFLATLYPAWRAARLDPVEALRYE